MQVKTVVRIIDSSPIGLSECMPEIQYPSANEGILKELREKFKLRDVIADCYSDAERFCALREWVRVKMVKHGWSFAKLREPVRDSLDILKHVENGVLFSCGFHSMVLRDIALCLGYPARTCGVWSLGYENPGDREGNIAHAITEIYSGEQGKWMMMDADANVHYELDGAILSCAELCEQNNINGGARVKAVYGKYLPGFDVTLDHDTGFVQGVAESGVKWTPSDVRRVESLFLEKDAIGFYQTLTVSEGDKQYSFTPAGVYPPLSYMGSPVNINKQYHTNNIRFIDHSPYSAYLKICDVRLLEHGAELDIAPITTMNNFSFFRICREDSFEDEKTAVITWHVPLGTSSITITPINEFGVSADRLHMTVRCTIDG